MYRLHAMLHFDDRDALERYRKANGLRSGGDAVRHLIRLNDPERK